MVTKVIKEKVDSLCISISTTKSGEDLHALLKKLEVYCTKLPDSISFFVLAQSKPQSLVDYAFTSRVSVLHSSTKGLSRSRNACVEACESKWIWFQDDDIELELKGCIELLEFLSSCDADIVLSRIGSLENRDVFYKDYQRLSFKFKHHSFKVSSIEIVAKVDSVVDVPFDERLGLGTNYPCGEENSFLIDCLDKGLIFTQSEILVCRHTTLPELRINKSVNHLIARGILLKKVNVVVCTILLARWSWRERKSLGFVKALLALIKGYKIKL